MRAHRLICALALLGACSSSLPTGLESCTPGAECELGAPLYLAQPSQPNVPSGTRLAACTLAPASYVVLAWVCQSEPGGDPQDAILQVDPGDTHAQQVLLPTPPCSAAGQATRWEGPITAGVNVVVGSAALPPGTTFRAVLLVFPELSP